MENQWLLDVDSLVIGNYDDFYTFLFCKGYQSDMNYTENVSGMMKALKSAHIGGVLSALDTQSILDTLAEGVLNHVKKFPNNQ